MYTKTMNFHKSCLDCAAVWVMVVVINPFFTQFRLKDSRCGLDGTIEVGVLQSSKIFSLNG